jgi:hypothetical protein
MKLIISTIVTAILLFLLGWLFYGVIFVGHLSTMYALMRPESDMKIWALIVGCLLQGLLLSIVYMRTYQGKSPFKEGLIYGLLIGFLFAIPYVFFMWSSYQITYRAVIADGIAMGIRILIAGIVIGLIFGKKKIET